MKKFLLIFGILLSSCQVNQRIDDERNTENVKAKYQLVITAASCNMENCQTSAKVLTEGEFRGKTYHKNLLLGAVGDTLLIETFDYDLKFNIIGY